MQERLIEWLQHAHAMEQGMIGVLEQHMRRATEFPAIRDHLDDHLAKTHAHREQVARCLRLLDSEPSLSQTASATVTGLMQGVTTFLQRDGVLKDMLADYAAESLEIASYTSLVAGARECGRPEIAAICREILNDEVEMAAWLEERIPEITVQVLHPAAV